MTVRKGKLIYDSARTGIRLGTRGVADARIALFRVGGYCIDLTIQVGPDRMGVFYGQVSAEDGGKPMVGARVGLDGHSDTRTDGHGQFALAGPRKGDASNIRIWIGDEELLCAIPGEDDGK